VRLRLRAQAHRRGGKASWLDDVRYHALVRAYFDRIAAALPGTPAHAAEPTRIDAALPA